MRTQETIRTLNRLIQVCRDGEQICRACAEAAESSDLRVTLRSRSDEWGRQGDELQALVLLLGGEPATTGTMHALASRAWLSLKVAVFGRRDLLVLEQWQRAQQRALDRYAEALSGHLPGRIRRSVSLQAGRVTDRYDQIIGLRERYATQSHGA